MPILMREAPTLQGVAQHLKTLEARYDLTTEAFLEMPCDDMRVDEDDAVEWEYLHAQLQALRESAVENLYTSPASGRERLLKNVAAAPQLLAA